MAEEEEVEAFEITDNDLKQVGFLGLGYRPYKSRGRLKEEATYGMWAEYDSDDDRSAVGGRRKKDDSRPLSFISGGVVQKGKDDDEFDEDDDGVINKEDELSFKPYRSKKLFNEEGLKTMNPGFARSKDFARKMKQSGGKQFGSWEKYTKGFGMKMLQKMGYQPGKGLGKEGKTGKASPKYIYKTADEIKATGSVKKGPSVSLKHSKVKVVDMTGPEAKILTGYGSLSQQHAKPGEVLTTTTVEEADAAFSMPELTYNLNLLVDMTEQDIIQTDKHCAAPSSSTTQNVMSLQKCEVVFKRLQDEFYEEYMMDELSLLAMPLVFPLVLRTWLTNNPNYDEITKWYKGWKTMFSDELLNNQVIKAQFNRALDIMNQAVSLPGEYLQPGAKEHIAYLTSIERRKEVEATAAVAEAERLRSTVSSTYMYIGFGSPYIGFGSPYIGFGSPCIGFGSPYIGFGSPYIDFGSPYIGFGSPYIGFDSPYIGFDSPYIGFDSPYIGFDSPYIDFGSPYIGFGSPYIGFDSPYIGFDSPYIGFDSPYIGFDSPYIGFGSPYIGFGSPYIGFDSPYIGFGSPYIGFDSPYIGFDSPYIGFDSPYIGFDSPYIGFGSPYIGFGSPYIGFGSPYIGFGIPTLALAVPTLALAVPTCTLALAVPTLYMYIDFGSPYIGFDSPYIGFGSPYIGFDSPYIGFGSPYIGFGSPYIGFDSPYIGFGSPYIGFDSP
ncbi:hypothetical protein QZH41_003480 [Actinostola sp. cb2023]|nr:hypothetical protein QZH41_003480 [Actinostola sp. cb2023]